MSVFIRLLGNADLESADAILKSAFRPSGNWIDELRLCHRIQPNALFLALLCGEESVVDPISVSTGSVPEKGWPLCPPLPQPQP